MKRYFAELSYKGTKYFGWQRQPKQNSVQEEIEKAISKLNSNKEVSIVGCGRTDTGVHAKSYFIHFEIETISDTEQFVYRLNKILPEDIVVYNVIESQKHARFDAKKRTYRYFIHKKKDAFMNDASWYLPHQININAMNEACQYILGTQDFTSFSKLHTDVKTNICTIYDAKWVKVNEQSYYFEISADRFLRNMVRAIVGTMLEVGYSKINVAKIKEIIDAKDRGAAALSVPAHGLFLWKIEY